MSQRIANEKVRVTASRAQTLLRSHIPNIPQRSLTDQIARSASRSNTAEDARKQGGTLTSTACRIGKDDARGSLVSLARLSASVLD
jgi:hypothetical protein